MDASTFIGRAPQQVERYLGEGGEVEGVLRKYRVKGVIGSGAGGGAMLKI